LWQGPAAGASSSNKFGYIGLTMSTLMQLSEIFQNSELSRAGAYLAMAGRNEGAAAILSSTAASSPKGSAFSATLCGRGLLLVPCLLK
jgi:hypothetical protein